MFAGDQQAPCRLLALHQGVSCSARQLQVAAGRGIGGTGRPRKGRIDPPTSQGAPEAAPAHLTPSAPVIAQHGERPLRICHNRRWRSPECAGPASPRRSRPSRPRRCIALLPGCGRSGSRALGTSVLQGPGQAQRIGAACRTSPSPRLDRDGSAPPRLTAGHDPAGPSSGIRAAGHCPPPLRAILRTGQAHVDGRSGRHRASARRARFAAIAAVT